MDQKMAKAISYLKLENTLAKLGAQLNAAETHGLLTGILSLAYTANAETWQSTLLDNLDCATPTKTQWGVLRATSNNIVEGLSDLNFSFDLLLPDDDMPLEERVDALCFWCRGYLSGLGLIGITKEDLANETINELIQDLSQLAHTNMETDASEDDENNFVELVEFVRVAVQNIQVELKSVEHSRMLH